MLIYVADQKWTWISYSYRNKQQRSTKPDNITYRVAQKSKPLPSESKNRIKSY